MGDQKLLAANAAVRDSISKLEVDAVGVALLADFKGSRLEEMALRLLPETHSVVVMASEIYTEILGHNRPQRVTGEASLNDLLDRNADYLSGRLTKAAYDVAKVSHRSGLKALPLPAAGCPRDARLLEAVFSYKHAAQAAGLGYIGHSSLLITSRFGPRVLLACCLTEAVLESRSVSGEDMCQGCDVCVESCPAHALAPPPDDASYLINKFACSIFRNAAGGCSECMRLCPAGKNR